MQTKDSATIAYSEPQVLTVNVLKNCAMSILQALADLRLISIEKTKIAFAKKSSFVPWMVKLEPTNENGLNKPSSIDCFQIRSVSQERLIKKLGEITDEERLYVKSGLA